MKFILTALISLFILTACAGTEKEVINASCPPTETTVGVKERLLANEGIALLADLKGQKNTDFLAWVKAKSGRADLPYAETDRTMVFTKVPHPAAMIVMFKEGCRIYALMGPRELIEDYLKGN